VNAEEFGEGRARITGGENESEGLDGGIHGI
jgi:hypothetical protein